MTTGTLHFTVQVEGLTPLIRQAYFMENKREWALSTLSALGIETEEYAMNVLNGKAILKSAKDGKYVIYQETEDKEWIGQLEGWKMWRDTNAYIFAGRALPRDLIDHYVKHIVGRLRNAMRLRFTFEDPLELLRLEEERQRIHKEILIAAGFEHELADHHSYEGKSEEYKEFDKAFSEYLDKQTKWLQQGGE